MKVCPLCEFIYEDDQNLCDMDGAGLIYDPAPLALAVTPEPAATLASTRWRRFSATAVIGVVLGTVLVLVFHVFTLGRQEQLSTTAAQKSNHSSDQATGDSAVPPNLDLSQPVPEAAPVDALPVPSPSASPQSPSPQSTHLRERSPKATSNVTSLVRPSPAPKLAKSTRTKAPAREREANRIESNHKQSSIGSFLKKTGRILKKPLGF